MEIISILLNPMYEVLAFFVVLIMLYLIKKHETMLVCAFSFPLIFLFFQAIVVAFSNNFIIDFIIYALCYVVLDGGTLYFLDFLDQKG